MQVNRTISFAEREPATAELAGRSCCLSPQESVVANLVCLGLSNKGIAARIGISEHTVASYLRRIYGKLGVDNRASMAAAVVRSYSNRSVIQTSGTTAEVTVANCEI